MTEKNQHAHTATPSPKRRQGFLLQCLGGVAAVGAVALIAHMAQPLAAAFPAKAPETIQQGMSLEELLRLAEISPFGGSQTGNYLAGRYAANTGDFENANLYLTRTLRSDTDNMEIAGYAYRMRLLTGDMEGASQMAEKLHEAGDRESNPEVMVLLSHIKTGDYAKAREILNGFQKDGFNLIILPLLHAWVDQAEGKLTQPVKHDAIVKRLAEFAPFIYYQSALINDMAGFEDEALEQYHEALSLSRAMPYRVVEMLGNLHERRGEWEKAEELYARYHTENPDTLLLPESRSAKKHKPARLVSSAREGVAEILFSTASILQNEGLHEEALIYVQQVLYLSPEFTAARLMRGTIYEALERHEAAVAEYDGLPRSSPYYHKAQLRKAYALNAAGKGEEALKLLKKLEKEPIDRYQVFLARGDILMREKRFDEAAVAYTQALQGIETVTPAHWPIYYARGISYERTNEWSKAEVDFLKALEMEPGQPDVMNYLGYSWLEQRTRIDEARKLIEQAVQLRPADAHIIDSMGWALYSMGDYDGAIEYLERAIELMPTDPTVNDHLGDAYWRMGRKTEARFQWRRALMFNPEEKQVEKLNIKLADGLPPAEPIQTAEEKEQQRVEVRQK